MPTLICRGVTATTKNCLAGLRLYQLLGGSIGATPATDRAWLIAPNTCRVHARSFEYTGPADEALTQGVAYVTVSPLTVGARAVRTFGTDAKFEARRSATFYWCAGGTVVVVVVVVLVDVVLEVDGDALDVEST